MIDPAATVLRQVAFDKADLEQGLATKYVPKDVFRTNDRTGKVYVVTVTTPQREREHLEGGWFLTREEAVASGGRPA